MGQIKVLFWFDVEDFINPESEEALVGILDLLESRGIVGIFKFVGEKMRKLEEHGRKDIIERLSRHEVGYHTDWHSIHPVVTEYMEPLGFREGADEFERREDGGRIDVGRISGQPVVCYGQPGQSWAPQTFPPLVKWNIRAYMDGLKQISLNDRPFWYGGMLNLTSLTGFMGMPLKEGALEPAKKRFDELCELQKDEEVGFISIVYHPTEFVFSEFWDAVNFSRGNNPPASEWVKPKFRPEGDMQRYLDMVGEFVDYTLSRENVSYVTTGHLLQTEKSEQRVLSSEEVIKFADQVQDQLGFSTCGTLNLSASELFWVFRQQLLGLEPIPDLVYGPERDVSDELQNNAAADNCSPVADLQNLRVKDILDALRCEMPTVSGFKQLPDYFDVAGCKISPVTITCTMAAIIRGGLAENDPIPLVQGKLTVEQYSSMTGEWSKWWVIFTENLEIPNVLELARLQTWTLKPALF